MAGDMKILLFGDQTLDPSEHLHSQLLRSRANAILADFILRVETALRNEVAQLPSSERALIPDFITIDELVDRARKSQAAHPAIASALLCISQLVHYIEYACDQYEKVHASSDTLIVGLCTGLLAAAAVASAPTIPALIPLGVETVLIAFRVGLHVYRVASRLGVSSGNRESWSSVVNGTNEAAVYQAISSFHKEKSIAKSNQAYISASSRSSVTISGPPSTLKQLFDSSIQLSASCLQVPVYGPYHAQHLHAEVNVQQILRSSSPQASQVLDQYTLKLPIVSTSTGSMCRKNTCTSDLLALLIHDILIEPLRLYEVFDQCVRSIKTCSTKKCYIITCGVAIAENSLATTLNTATDAEVVLHQPNRHLSSNVQPSQTPRSSKRTKLAIVGMAGRFPDAADHEKFWDLLEAGRDVHRKIPKDRFDVEKHYDPTGKKRNTSHTPFGCFIEDPGLFDPRFFNMSPREATQTDPMHRLGLASAYEALEMAGYVPNRTPSTKLDRIGTFYGQTSDDWREINAAQEVDTYFITGGVRAFAPGRINYYFKFSGPSFSVDTACSSSMAAIQLACTSLWAGDCDTAVAGGLNVMTNSDIFAGLSRGQFLSKTGNCQTYDNDADGYCRGDGIGTLILKRLEDAQADNDRILGVILETMTNHSANAISITHPHAPTQETLFHKVMDSAGVDPHDVNYVEMHGTGTQAGDGTEMRSVTNVFAPTERKGQRKKPLHLGSVKANIGHGEAVSGVTALIKCLLMMQKNSIPPHCGIKKSINQSFPQDLMARNVHIAFKTTPLLSRDGSPRRIFVNNFSAAGGNTALLLEDSPNAGNFQNDRRSYWVVAVSAKSMTALKANTRRLIRYIDDNPELRIADLSYTTTARRIQHGYRTAFGCSNISQAREILTSKLDDSCEPVPGVPPKVAFVFTGQGSHYAELGRALFDLSSQFRSDLLGFDSISKSQGFPSFLPLIEGNIMLNQLPPIVVQVGLTSIQMALTRLWRSWGIKPDIVLGHSLGEYAALDAAGIISSSDAIFLVGERARLLQDRCTAVSHAMLAVKASASTVSEVISNIPGVEIACINAPGETVLSGMIADIDIAANNFFADGIKCTKLNVQYAFHSSQVDPILSDFKKIAGYIEFHTPQIPIISPLLASIITDKVDANYLCRHARETVNFSGGIAVAQQNGLINDNTVWLEIGPHPVCSSFIKAEFGAGIITVPSLRKDMAPYNVLSNSLSTLHTVGVNVDWNEFHRDFLTSLQMLDLPTYAFDNKNYWIQYTGDWNLSKGKAGSLAVLPEITAPKLSTTSVHKILSEVVDVDKATVVVESDVSRPDLLAAVSGHMVNGTALCPSSLYADMAYTVGEYLYKTLRPGCETVSLNVCDMEVSKPFVAETAHPKPQIIRLSATNHLASNRADLVFSSGSGKSTTEHAKCHVVYGSGSSWLAEWQRNAYLIRGRIDSLKKAASTGEAHRMLRGMAYKLFAAFVDYDNKYRGMEEVILDSPQLEATSHVAFQTSGTDGNFVCSPYWIDSVAHLAGFVVNANETLDSAKQVYISHGWESMRFAEPLLPTKTYRSYVKMQPAGGNMMSGDVYIFDGDRIIGLVGALRFQCIPRQLLNTFLPPKGSSIQKVPTAATKSLSLKAMAIKPSAAKTVRKPKSKDARSKRTPAITTKALDIVASELGIPVGELADPIEFTSLGVDSLMSLSITGRMREELEIEVQSSLFTDYPTVHGMKGFLSQYDLSEIVEELLDETDRSLTPDNDSDDTSSSDETVSTPTTPGSTGLPNFPEAPSDSESLSMIIRETISTEMGVDARELMSADDLGSLGMDSLMSLSILGVLREKTGLSLSATFLNENPSIKAIEKSLQISTPEEVRPISKTLVAKPQIPTTTGFPERFATSVLLQGSPKTAGKNFWLIPDGSGSATSYVFMPEISRNIAVWGLNSPYMKSPEEYRGGVVGMATKFILEIKRRQPQGPYNIGGWSAGGVISFETVRQLIDSGDTVEMLALIDTPCPLIIEPLPSSLHRFFGSIGLLGEGDGALERLPVWLLPHFAASVQALSTYKAQKIDTSKCPKVFAIWCEDGVCKYPEDPRPDPYPYGHAQFLLENRTDFGPNLWDEYLDKDKISCRQMSGNHFTMMRDPYVTKLTEFLREALM